MAFALLQEIVRWQALPSLLYLRERFSSLFHKDSLRSLSSIGDSMEALQEEN